MQYCPDCGTANADDTVFCQNCDLNLQKIGVTPGPTQQHVESVQDVGKAQDVGSVTSTSLTTCQNCGKEYATKVPFCGNCGSKIEESVQQEAIPITTSAPAQETLLVCGNCGLTNKPGNKFCGNCGGTMGGAAKVESSYAPRGVNTNTPNQPAYAAPMPNKFMTGNEPVGTPGAPAAPLPPLPPVAQWPKNPQTAYLGSFFIPGFAYYYTENMNYAAFAFLGTIGSFALELDFIGIAIWAVQFLQAGTVVKSYVRRILNLQ